MKQASLTAFRRDNVVGINNRTMLRFPFEGVPGAWMLISFGEDLHKKNLFRDLDYRDLYINAFMTFFYDNDGLGSEWEPQYGPIQTWVSCEENWEGEDCFGKPITSREHWFYSYVEDHSLSWSQMAVDKEDLKGKLLRGDLAGIFDSLRRWSERAR